MEYKSAIYEMIDGIEEKEEKFLRQIYTIIKRHIEKTKKKKMIEETVENLKLMNEKSLLIMKSNSEILKMRDALDRKPESAKQEETEKSRIGDDRMVYPKKIMNRKELMTLGFTEAYLMRAVSAPGQKFATRENPLRPCSPILFDTDEFEKWRMEDIAMQERARKQTVVA